MAFQLAHKKTAEFEGIYSDHAADKGGATKYGVSIEFLKGFALNEHVLLDRLGVIMPITKDAVRELTKEQAEQILKREFWDKLNLDELPLAIAFCFYDMAMNHGKSAATLIMQRAVNALGNGAKLVEDGKYGAKTQKAINRPFGEFFLDCIVNERLAYYRKIIANHPTQKAFENGWMRRAREMGDYARTLLT